MKLFWSEPALADIESIRDYIRRDSEFYAGRFINRIIEAVETLVELPARGRLVPEADDPNTRELLFQNYRIMYRLESARIVFSLLSMPPATGPRRKSNLGMRPSRARQAQIDNAEY